MHPTETHPPMQADMPVVAVTDRLQILADCVTSIYRKSVADILDIGRILNHARTTLHHGEWEKIFKGHLQAVARPVPFSLPRGRKYMSIADHPVLSNHSHWNDLPQCWTTLYELSLISVPVLEELLASGAVHAELTGREAAALRNQQSGLPGLADVPKDESPIAWSIDAAKARLLVAINRELECAPPESRPLIADLVLRMAEQLKESDSPELREAVMIARDELNNRDSEPGANRIYEDEAQAGTHPGSPRVIGSCPSTHGACYKRLTRRKPDVTPLTRKQVEARLDDIDKGKLPTAKTEHTHNAVLWEIRNLSRTSPLGRGAG